MTVESILWRRLDAPGHDACRLEPVADGWRLDGAAVFRHEGAPARLAYRVSCDTEWRSREGTVHGWIGSRVIDCLVRRTMDGAWTLNGATAPKLDGCVDLDFGFTPATNLFQLRRIALRIGKAADVPVAWLDAPADTLTMLHQRYERRSETEYWYDAPRFGYAAMLAFNAAGFARTYPGLWEAEP